VAPAGCNDDAIPLPHTQLEGKLCGGITREMMSPCNISRSPRKKKKEKGKTDKGQKGKAGKIPQHPKKTD